MVMTRRRFALIFGILFLMLGIAGFVPQLMHDMHPEFPPLKVDANSGELLGLFPVNFLHSAVHILFGLWGLIASRSVSGAKINVRAVGIIIIVLAIVGFIPGMLNGFGLMLLYGNDIWLDGVIGLVAAYFGWVRRDPVATITT